MLSKNLTANIRQHGVTIYLISLKSTFIPQEEKNFCTPNGETFISLKGKKNLLLSNGTKKPMPLPPEVIASKIPCDSVDIKITKNQMVLFFLPKVNIKINAQMIENRIE